MTLALTGGGAACLMFASQPPCNSNSNCPQNQICDLKARACVDRTAGHDSGVTPPDASQVDGAVSDASQTDTSLLDSSVPDAAATDSARTDSAGRDQQVSDATGNDQRVLDATTPDQRQPDRWRPDMSLFDSSGCVDNDHDGYGVACPLGLDCDDNDVNVYDGTPCNDGNGSTSYDTCRNGVCRGVYTSATSCSGGCATCPGSPCCTNACTRPYCPNCVAGCSCYFTFTDSPGHGISLACQPGSSCALKINNGASASTTCDHATCYQDCSSISGACSMDCLNGASCILYCNDNQSNCTITSCPGGKQNCSDGHTAVCNATCPS